jgi:hypothetical protein
LTKRIRQIFVSLKARVLAVIRKWICAARNGDFLLYLFASLTPLTLFGKLLSSTNLFYGDGSILSTLLPRWAFDQALIRSGHMPPSWTFSIHNGVPWTAGGNSSNYWAYIILLWLFSLKTAHAAYTLGHFAMATTGFARLLRSLSMNWAACLLGGLLFISVGPVENALITGSYDSLAAMCYWPWIAFFSLRFGRLVMPRDAAKLMVIFWAIGTTGLGYHSVLGAVLSICFVVVGWLHCRPSNRIHLVALWTAAVSLPILINTPLITDRWVAFTDPFSYAHLLPAKLAPLVSLSTLLSTNYFQSSVINQVWFDWFDGDCQLGPTCLLIPLLLLTRRHPKLAGYRAILFTLLGTLVLSLCVNIPSLQAVLPQGRQWCGPTYFLLVVLCSQAIDTVLRTSSQGEDRACLGWLVFLGALSVVLCYLPSDAQGLWGKFLTEMLGVTGLQNERSQSILIAIYLRTLWAFLLGSGLWIVRSIPPSHSRVALLSILIWSDLQGNLYPQIIQASPDLFTCPREVEIVLSQLGSDDRLCLPTARGGQALSLGASEVALRIEPILSFGRRFAELCGQPNYREAIDAGSYSKYLVELGVRYFVLNTKWDAVNDPKDEASSIFKELSSLPASETYIYEYQNTLPRVFLTDSWDSRPDAPELKTLNLTDKEKPVVQIAENLPKPQTKLSSSEQVYNLGSFATQISVCARITEPRLICFRDSFSRLIEASIDGENVKPLPVNGGLMTAVLCPGGEHRIILKPKQTKGFGQVVHQVGLALALSWLTFVALSGSPKSLSQNADVSAEQDVAEQENDAAKTEAVKDTHE